MNRYEMLKHPPGETAPGPTEPVKRGRRIQEKAESEEAPRVPNRAPHPIRLVRFDSRYLLKDLNTAYNPESLDYAMLKLLKPRSTMRATLIDDNEVVFLTVKGNNPEERKIFLRSKREIVNYEGTHSEYRGQIGSLLLDRWHTYEEMTVWSIDTISFFYYLGIKRGAFGRFFDDWNKIYD